MHFNREHTMWIDKNHTNAFSFNALRRTHVSDCILCKFKNQYQIQFEIYVGIVIRLIGTCAFTFDLPYKLNRTGKINCTIVCFHPYRFKTLR